MRIISGQLDSGHERMFLHIASCVLPRSGKVRSREDWVTSRGATSGRRGSDGTVGKGAGEVVHLRRRPAFRMEMTT